MNIVARKPFMYMLVLALLLIVFESAGVRAALADNSRPAPRSLAESSAVSYLPAAAANSANLTGASAVIERVYLPDFGQFVANPILRFWRMNGRTAGLGGPISQAFVTEQGHTVQYFQKMAVAYFPELANTAWAVRPYHIGRLYMESQTEDIKNSFPFSRVAEQPSTKTSRYFLETGHSLSAGFLNLYNTSGELFMWGFPISEEYSVTLIDGKTYNAQIFERGRMLWNAATGARIDPDFGTSMAALIQAPISVESNEAGPGKIKAPNYNSSLWEHWVDVNLSGQYETFYEGDVPIRTSYVATGKRGFETPTGTFYILQRVANERMRGGSIGSEEYYDLDNVLFTQYFTWEGHALHYAWWRSSFGYVASHGCVNEDYNTAEFAWNWLSIGSRVSIHY